MTIKVVDHVNIATERLEETRAFYVDALGLVEGYRPEFSFPGYWLYAGDRPVVHLQPSNGPVGPSDASALNHFAFDVEDLDGMLARLERLGIPYEVRDIPSGAGRQAFLEDPNGVRLELNFRTPGF